MEKTMGMFDDIVGSAVPKGSLAKPLILALVALLASGSLFKGGAPDASAKGSAAAPPDEGDGGLLGGLGGLLNRFQQNGLGDEINSWIGPGQNKQVPANQLGPFCWKRLSRGCLRSCRKFFLTWSTSSRPTGACRHDRKPPRSWTGRPDPAAPPAAMPGAAVSTAAPSPDGAAISARLGAAAVLLFSWSGSCAGMISAAATTSKTAGVTREVAGSACRSVAAALASVRL